MKKNHKEKGFSLIELLVVVIIIGVIAAIAIPSLLASKRAANEASAIQSVRAIHNANITYHVTTGANVNYATLTQLSGGGLLDPTFTGASLVKSGYTIAESVSAPPTGYCATAVPTTTGSGTRYFGVNQSGVIYQTNVAAEITCAAGVFGTSGSAAPIQ